MKGVFIPMTIEEIKIALTKTFKNRQDPVVMAFLEQSIENNTSYHGLISNKLEKYLPMYLQDHNLGFTVNGQYDENTKTRYNEILFDHNVPTKNHNGLPYPQGWFRVLRANMEYPSLENTFRVTIESGQVRFGVYSDVFVFEKDFSLSLKKGPLVNGIEFDIVNKTHRMLGTSSVSGVTPQKFANDALCLFSKGYVLDTAAWEATVDATSSADSRFAQAAKECELAKLVQKNIWVTITLLSKYVEMNDFKYFLQDDAMRKLMEAHVNVRIGSSQDPFESLNTVFRKGANFYEVLGLKSEMAEFIDSRGRDFKLQNMVHLSKALESLSAHIKIETSQDIYKILKIVGVNDFYNQDIEFGRLVYLLNRGYTVDELYSFLNRAYIKEAVEMKEGFGLLYHIVVLNELVDGEKKKMFPKYLKVAFDVIQRQATWLHQEWVDGENDLLENNFKKKVAHLLHDGDGFEVIAPEKGQVGMKFYLSSSMDGIDRLIFKKKRGSKGIDLVLWGDMLVHIHEKVSEKYEKAIRSWAKEKGLVVTNMGLFR